MITDERDLAQSLRTVDTPPGLTLDPDQVLSRAHRVDRRHKAGRGVLATGAVAAVAATALWATGTAVGPIAVLPAAPWTDGCQGIVEASTGTSINLDQVSHAELPLPGAADGSVVVALDACGGGDARLAQAIRGTDGQLAMQGWTEADEATLQTLRVGETVTPQPVRTSAGEVLAGVVASDATGVQVLSATGVLAVQRETIADSGLDAYVSHEFSDPEQGTIGMTWQDGASAVHVVWLQVLDTADFDDTVDVTRPLIAQSRDGLWRIWFGEEQANMAGDLGSWLSVDFVEGEGRETVVYLPEGADIEVTGPDGTEAVGATIQYAEPHVAEGRFAWVSAPSGSDITWVGSDGAREALEGAPTAADQ